MRINLTWKSNPDNSRLAAVQIGNRVLLQADDAWQYSVQADVVAVDGHVLTAMVIDVFDRAAGTQIRGGEVTEIIGKTVVFESRNVFAVIKKPQ